METIFYHYGTVAAITEQQYQGTLEQHFDISSAQARLADQAGVSKRTLERIEAGGAAQLASLVRLCRALGLLERLDALIREPAANPIAQLKLRDKERRRASGVRVSEPAPSNTPTR